MRAISNFNFDAGISTRECLADQGSIMGRKAGALVIDGEHVSIDTEWDIELVEWVLSREKLQK